MTVIQDQKPLTRKVSRTLEKPLDQLQTSDHAILTFAAWLESGKKARISAQEIVGLKSGTSVSQIPQVDEVLNEAISLIRQDAGI